MIKGSMEFITGNTRPAEDTLPIVKGEGIYFWDEDGKKYIDFASHTLNLLLGQCYPSVVEAVIKQVKELTYATSRFGTSTYFRTAKKIVEAAPKGFTAVNIKMCDGSDANETAVKLARKYTGKSAIIAFNLGHTGQTTQTIQLRGYGKDPGLLNGSQEDVIFVHPPRCEVADDYLSTINEIQSVIGINNNIAAILIDPLMVNAGLLVNESTKVYLQAINEICKENNILMILDENQSFGWIDGIFATNYYEIDPDIITLGKGLSGGYPLAGVLLKEHLKDVLSYNEADFTNGGHTVSCSAAYEVIEVLQKKDFLLTSKYDYISEKISAINEISDLKYSSRGVGLIHCIEILEGNDNERQKLANQIFKGCLHDGLFIRQYNNKLILKPPIIVDFYEIDQAFNIIYGNISEYCPLIRSSR